MNQSVIILLANFLMGANTESSTSGKKSVIIGDSDKFISDFFKISPDLDVNLIAKKAITETELFCNFLATTDYEKVIILFHGYSSGLTLDETKGVTPTFELILSTLQKLTIKSKIKEIEFFSCLAGVSAKSLFEIAQVLKAQITAHTFLRARKQIKFSGTVNDAILRNLEIFKAYFVFGKNDTDIKTLLRNHGNALTFQYFFPVSFDQGSAIINSIDFVHFTREKTYEKLIDLQNKRQRSHADAAEVTISNIADATSKENDYKKPQFTLFEHIKFVPASSPKP